MTVLWVNLLGEMSQNNQTTRQSAAKMATAKESGACFRARSSSVFKVIGLFSSHEVSYTYSLSISCFVWHTNDALKLTASTRKIRNEYNNVLTVFDRLLHPMVLCLEKYWYYLYFEAKDAWLVLKRSQKQQDLRCYIDLPFFLVFLPFLLCSSYSAQQAQTIHVIHAQQIMRNAHL